MWIRRYWSRENVKTFTYIQSGYYQRNCSCICTFQRCIDYVDIARRSSTRGSTITISWVDLGIYLKVFTLTLTHSSVPDKQYGKLFSIFSATLQNIINWKYSCLFTQATVESYFHCCAMLLFRVMTNRGHGHGCRDVVLPNCCCRKREMGHVRSLMNGDRENVQHWREIPSASLWRWWRSRHKCWRQPCAWRRTVQWPCVGWPLSTHDQQHDSSCNAFVLHVCWAWLLLCCCRLEGR